MYLQNAFKFQINIVCHQWRCYNIYLVWLILLLLISCWTCRRKKGKHKRLKLNPSWLNKERFWFWYHICQLIFIIVTNKIQNVLLIYFFFTILFSAACHVVLPIKLDAIKIILHLRVCCGRFFFLRWNLLIHFRESHSIKIKWIGIYVWGFKC